MLWSYSSLQHLSFSLTSIRQHWNSSSNILFLMKNNPFNRCRNFSSDLTPIYFMEAESQTRCWTKFHIFWSVAIALPNFLLWAVVLPLILLLRLRKNAKNLSNPEVYVKYSFVYEGLKTDKYFW